MPPRHAPGCGHLTTPQRDSTAERDIRHLPVPPVDLHSEMAPKLGTTVVSHQAAGTRGAGDTAALEQPLGARLTLTLGQLTTVVATTQTTTRHSSTWGAPGCSAD